MSFHHPTGHNRSRRTRGGSVERQKSRQDKQRDSDRKKKSSSKKNKNSRRRPSRSDTDSDGSNGNVKSTKTPSGQRQSRWKTLNTSDSDSDSSPRNQGRNKRKHREKKASKKHRQARSKRGYRSDSSSASEPRHSSDRNRKSHKKRSHRSRRRRHRDLSDSNDYDSDGNGNKIEQETCVEFARFGNCQYGSNCRFAHTVPKKSKQGNGICFDFWSSKRYCSEIYCPYEHTDTRGERICFEYMNGKCHASDCAYFHVRPPVGDRLCFDYLQKKPCDGNCGFLHEKGKASGVCFDFWSTSRNCQKRHCSYRHTFDDSKLFCFKFFSGKCQYKDCAYLHVAEPESGERVCYDYINYKECGSNCEFLHERGPHRKSLLYEKDVKVGGAGIKRDVGWNGGKNGNNVIFINPVNDTTSTPRGDQRRDSNLRKNSGGFFADEEGMPDKKQNGHATGDFGAAVVSSPEGAGGVAKQCPQCPSCQEQLSAMAESIVQLENQVQDLHDIVKVLKDENHS